MLRDYEVEKNIIFKSSNKIKISSIGYISPMNTQAQLNGQIDIYRGITIYTDNFQLTPTEFKLSLQGFPSHPRY